MRLKTILPMIVGLAVVGGGVIALTVPASANPANPGVVEAELASISAEPIDEGSVDAALEAAGPGHGNYIRSKLAKRAIAEHNKNINESNRKCDKYLKKGEGNCRGTAWCGAFTRWVWSQTTGVNKRVPKSPLWATNWGTSKNTSYFKLRGSGKGNAQVGDVVVYGRPGTSGHVAIVVKVHGNGNIDTVDGNSGNKVAHKKNIDPRRATGNGQRIWGYRKPV